ncbi:MAG: hypothetical protein VX498_13655 [Myxococcota bacterium]|nr:hypothetical protein [Myxococcota bacterium]
MRRRIVIPCLLAAFLLPSVAAAGPDDHQVSWGTDVEVGADEALQGDVVVIGADAQIEGSVSGDVVVVGGDLKLGPSARIGGDAVVTAGKLNLAAGAQVEGDKVELADTAMATESLVGQLSSATATAASKRPPAVELQGDRPITSPMATQSFGLRTVSALVGATLLLILGHLFLWLCPIRTRNVRRTIEASPGRALLVGGMVSLALGLLGLLLFVSLIGWPALPILGLVVFVLWTMGLTGLCEAIGDRFPLPLRLRSRSGDLVVGTLVFMLLLLAWAVGGTVGTVAILLLLLTGCVAIGSVLLSSAGKRPYGPV